MLASRVRASFSCERESVRERGQHESVATKRVERNTLAGSAAHLLGLRAREQEALLPKQGEAQRGLLEFGKRMVPLLEHKHPDSAVVGAASTAGALLGLRLRHPDYVCAGLAGGGLPSDLARAARVNDVGDLLDGDARLGDGGGDHDAGARPIFAAERRHAVLDVHARVQHIKRYALWQARCGESALEHVVHPLDHRVRGREDKDGAAVLIIRNRARHQLDR